MASTIQNDFLFQEFQCFAKAVTHQFAITRLVNMLSNNLNFSIGKFNNKRVCNKNCWIWNGNPIKIQAFQPVLQNVLFIAFCNSNGPLFDKKFVFNLATSDLVILYLPVFSDLGKGSSHSCTTI